MKIKNSLRIGLLVALVGVFGVVILGGVIMRAAETFAEDGGEGKLEHFVTIYDAGEKTIVKSEKMTVREVLERTKITVDEEADIVEPGLDEEISGRDFYVNVYRAKPVVVVDGARTVKVMTAASIPRDIAEVAGVELYDEDIVEVAMNNVFLASGVPFSYVVTRAKLVKFDFYGAAAEVRTQAKTVGDFLAERKIKISEDDWLSKKVDEKITVGMELALYRNGKSVITVDETMPHGERVIYDYEKNVGYRETTVAGKDGRKTVTYEIEMFEGQEVGRVWVSEMVVEEAEEAVVTMGRKSLSMNPLTKSMGRNKYTTTEGILREETYYDLPMTKVMGNCGGGGVYTVRADGVKVDKDGYVIIAADLGRYPRCSIVETSLGAGKVYDTGSFALTKPEQFDIATDWTKRDGR